MSIYPLDISFFKTKVMCMLIFDIDFTRKIMMCFSFEDITYFLNKVMYISLFDLILVTIRHPYCLFKLMSILNFDIIIFLKNRCSYQYQTFIYQLYKFKPMSFIVQSKQKNWKIMCTQKFNHQKCKFQTPIINQPTNIHNCNNRLHYHTKLSYILPNLEKQLHSTKVLPIQSAKDNQICCQNLPSLSYINQTKMLDNYALSTYELNQTAPKTNCTFIKLCQKQTA